MKTITEPAILISFALCAQIVRSEPVVSPNKFVFDVDGGADDIFALSLALLNPTLVNVVAVTTVFGNTDISSCTNNVLRTLQVFNRTDDVPVYVGCGKGMVYPTPSDAFFGHDGLGDNQWNESLKITPEATHAARFLADLVSLHPGEIILVATGALTNLALAQHLNPSFLQDLGQLYVMGGAYQGRGNVRPGVEFNFFLDPLAAEFVLSESRNSTVITLLPLETTPPLPMTWRVNELGTIQSPYIEFLNKAERKILSRESWSPNDQLMVSVAMSNDIIADTLDADGSVLTEGGDAKGALLINYKSSLFNLKIITQVDQASFQNFVLNSFSKRAAHWHKTPKRRQAKRLITISTKRAKALLSLKCKDLRTIAGLLTGHCPLRYHLTKMGKVRTEECRFCCEEVETAEHILCECSAVASARFRHFGKGSLVPADVSQATPGILHFVKEEVIKRVLN